MKKACYVLSLVFLALGIASIIYAFAAGTLFTGLHEGMGLFCFVSALIFWKLYSSVPAKASKLLFLGICSTCLASILVVAGCLYLLTRGMCGNSIHEECISPNKELKAVVFERSGGATTGFSTQISILRATARLRNTSGNIYIIDGHPKHVAPRLAWRGNKELVIYRSLNGSEYKAKKEWGLFKPVTISYEREILFDEWRSLDEQPDFSKIYTKQKI